MALGLPRLPEEDDNISKPRDECSKVLVSSIFGHGFDSRQLHQRRILSGDTPYFIIGGIIWTI